MNEIQTKLIKFANIRKKSINHCLLVLGADVKEVYFDHNIQKKVNPRCKLLNPCNATPRSIYDDLSCAEMLDWAKHLYIESLKKYHPDLHPENPRLYTEICQELGKAYEHAKHILNCGR